jgi:hypothetical protein
MRFARGDMRDHIVSHKNDHGASYERYGVLQWWSRLKLGFCEIFGVVQFSTFATLSVKSRPTGPSPRRSASLSHKRTSAARWALTKKTGFVRFIQSPRKRNYAAPAGAPREGGKAVCSSRAGALGYPLPTNFATFSRTLSDGFRLDGKIMVRLFVISEENILHSILQGL